MGSCLRRNDGWVPAFAGMTDEQLHSQWAGERLEWPNLVNRFTWLTIGATPTKRNLAMAVPEGYAPSALAQDGNAIPGHGLRDNPMDRAQA
jgi:hypothetical protein